MKCDVADCNFEHAMPRAIGTHKLHVHGIRGTSVAAIQRRAEQKRRPTLLEQSMKKPLVKVGKEAVSAAMLSRSDREARNANIFKYRDQGYSYQEIANLMGVSVAVVSYAVTERERKAVPQFSVKGRADEQIAAETNGNAILNNHVSYCFGRTEAWLEVYADGAGISRADVANGVAKLLLGKARR